MAERSDGNVFINLLAECHLFSYCRLYFCLHGGKEHCQLKLSQFEVKEEGKKMEGKMMKAVADESCNLC